MTGRLRRRLRRDGSSGQASVELLGLLPYMFIFFFLVVQMFAYVLTVEKVESAVRAGARVQSQGGDGTQAARDALPERIEDEGVEISIVNSGGASRATVTAQVPVLIKGADIDWAVTRKATIPIG